MEAGLPSGTVTFLFTDIEGSTRLWETAPGAMRAALERHDAVLRSAVDAHGGYVFATGGDGIAAAFARAADALAAAVDAQRDLSTIAWPNPVVLRVRMGIHTGEATEHDGDYVGTAVSRAARLMSAAHGGQVVVSAVTEGLVRDALPEEVELVDLGEHRLRDLARPMRVFEAALIGVGLAFPPLRSLDAFPGNVPSALSSFVGRDREVAQAAATLEEGRLLTLTGVGGVGKTRLALQVAAEVLLRFRDGVWLCELAPVRDGAAVADALAAVFDLAPRTGQAVEQTVAEFLRWKELLLVLDNCEHLLGPVAAVVERLERFCPHLSVIATSREGLSIEGERILAVPSLAAPPADAGIEAVASADAVRLFVDRARAVKAEFALTATNAAAVAQVCRRLDGVPLAIELAAARIPAMNPAELVRRLDRRFDVLAGGRRGAVERHQTLRAAIDWSYDMLDEPQRRLLARLSVFAGGCTPEAAEAVCGGDPVDAGAVWEMMAGLVARSLVVAEDQGLDTRYRLLETIRQYGEERLDAYGETVALRHRHAEYYASLGAALGDRSGGPDEDDALAHLAADQDNFTRAMHSALDADDADLAFRLLLGAPPPAMQNGFGFRFGAEPVLSIPGSAPHPPTPSASSWRPSSQPFAAISAPASAGWRRPSRPLPSMVLLQPTANGLLGSGHSRSSSTLLAWVWRSALARGAKLQATPSKRDALPGRRVFVAPKRRTWPLRGSASRSLGTSTAPSRSRQRRWRSPARSVGRASLAGVSAHSPARSPRVTRREPAPCCERASKLPQSILRRSVRSPKPRWSPPSLATCL